MSSILKSLEIGTSGVDGEVMSSSVELQADSPTDNSAMQEVMKNHRCDLIIFFIIVLLLINCCCKYRKKTRPKTHKLRKSTHNFCICESIVCFSLELPLRAIGGVGAILTEEVIDEVEVFIGYVNTIFL